MSTLRNFLRRSFRNNRRSRVLYLSDRLHRVLTLDYIEGTQDALKFYLKYGEYGWACANKPEL